MRRSLATALIAFALLPGPGAAQVLDDTMVPRGQLRLQAHPVFWSWDTRFGRAADGSEGREKLGEDLTDPSGISVFPGASAMVGHVADISGAPYAPELGPVDARVTKDVTRIEFGGHLGVFDWLTVGMIVPWMQTRSSVDLNFVPDTVGGLELGLNPRLSSAASVDGYLNGLTAASAAAEANAVSVCASSPGSACASAQALAQRASSLLGSALGAYDASALFPLQGTPAAVALAGVSSGLDADLVAAGLPPIGAAMAFATDSVSAETLLQLPALSGSGLEGAPLATRRGLWQYGDVEISARFRLLEGGPRSLDAEPGGLAYQLTAGVMVRLPTGTPEDPDLFLDVGTGDGQLDVEGHARLALAWGRLALVAGGRYGVQRSGTVTRRVAPPEQALPPASTRAELRFTPGTYLDLEAAPTLRLTDELSLTGHVRHLSKRRDQYELVDPSLPLDPVVLEVESGMARTQVGGGLRYDTVRRWQDGVAARPIELHLRLVHSIAGGGGQTPVTTRVEAGIRLFRRFWGPEPSG